MILDVLVLTNTVKARTEEEGFWKKKKSAINADCGQNKQLTVSKCVSHLEGQN